MSVQAVGDVRPHTRLRAQVWLEPPAVHAGPLVVQAQHEALPLAVLHVPVVHIDDPD